jgi:hypothetical protein
MINQPHYKKVFDMLKDIDVKFGKEEERERSDHDKEDKAGCSPMYARNWAKILFTSLQCILPRGSLLV